MKRRTWLLVPALLFLAWEVVAIARWFRAGASVARSWEAALADPMALLFLSDGMMFALVAIVAMVADLRRGGGSTARCAAWAAAVLVVGSPALLFFLARRTQESDHVPAAGR